MSLARRLPILPMVAGNSLSALSYNHPFPLRPPLPHPAPSRFFFFQFFEKIVFPLAGWQKELIRGNKNVPTL